jgi:hypothetical protein
MMFFWVRTPCALDDRSQRFGQAYCLHLQGCFPFSVALSLSWQPVQVSWQCKKDELHSGVRHDDQSLYESGHKDLSLAWSCAIGYNMHSGANVINKQGKSLFFLFFILLLLLSPYRLLPYSFRILTEYRLRNVLKTFYKWLKHICIQWNI